jgi:capsular exopolysaccharide synthesis family protein
MDHTNPPVDPTRAPFQATGAPFGVTGAPFGSTTAPFSPGGGGRPPPQADDFSFKEMLETVGHALRIIRAKWYWGMLAALAVAGPVGYLLFTRPVEVTAQTDLLAQTMLAKVIGTQGDAANSSDVSRENNLRNHLSMMTSRKFIARLEASFTPEEQALIAAPYLAPGAKFDDAFFQDFFQGKIAIDRERGREYYTILVSHVVPTTAIMVADRMASEYLNFIQEEYKNANVEGYNLLEKQADALRAEIARIESERLDFRKKNGIISRADNQSILTERLKRLDGDLTDIRVKRRSLETVTKQAQADRARSKFPWENSYLAGFANNETLRQQLDQQLAQRAVLATRYGPNHPKMKDADSGIAGIEASLQRNFDVAVRDLEAQLNVAKQNEALLTKEFDDSFKSSIEIEKLASNYEILSAGVASKIVTLSELEKKIGDASVSSQLPADFMQVVDPAFLVKRRIPKQVLYGIAVALLFLGAMAGGPLVANALNEKVSGSSDLEKVLGLELVGAIHNLKIKAKDRAHVVRNRIDPVIAEAFVGCAGHLEIGSGRRYPMVLVVTSTLPGEGKSLIASNLASTFRQLGKKTLLMDLDLRRPVQHSLHGVTQETGFLTWARDGFPEDDLLAPDGPLGIRKLVDGTDLLCAGGDESQPGTFFAADAMDRLFDRLKNAYDVVVIDTPPAGVFQDALMIARRATSAVLVAREGISPVIQARHVIEQFAKANLAFHGAVLNGFIPRNANKKLAYGYKGAAKGYSYGAAKTSGRRAQRVVPTPAPAKA